MSMPLTHRITDLLTQIGPSTVADLELCMPTVGRAKIIDAMGRLRQRDRVHIPGKKTVRHPVYHLGSDPKVAPKLAKKQEQAQERRYLESINPHLKKGWKPRPDVATGWMSNTAVLMPNYMANGADGAATIP